MASASTSAFIFATILDGRPARAWSASRSISPSTASCRPSGATISLFHFGGALYPVSRLKRLDTSSQMSGRDVNSERSV
jgi:hypothetical protein